MSPAPMRTACLLFMRISAIPRLLAVPVRLCAAEACQAVGGRELKAEWAKACGDDADLAALTGVDEPIFCLGNCALGPPPRWWMANSWAVPTWRA